VPEKGMLITYKKKIAKLMMMETSTLIESSMI